MAVLAVIITVAAAYSYGIVEVRQDRLMSAFDDVRQVVLDDVPGAVADVASDAGTASLIRDESGFDGTVMERHVYELTNAERERHGLPGLIRDPRIDSVARGHSQDMADRGYFDHVTPEGLDPTARGSMSGYDCRKDYGTHYTYGLAENIFLGHTYSSYMAKGVKSTYSWMADEEAVAESIVDGWMDSPGHRANILDGAYGRIGVGVAISPDEEVYATQNFC